MWDSMLSMMSMQTNTEEAYSAPPFSRSVFEWFVTRISFEVKIIFHLFSNYLLAVLFMRGN